MNAVLGVGRLLADTPLTLEQQQLVAMITNSGQLLLTIINDILDYSKIEAGQLNLNYSSQNVNEVLESAVLLCYDMAASKGLELSWFVEPSLPPALLIDATRLQQVILNLLSNAIKVSGLCEFVGRTVTAVHSSLGSGCCSNFPTLILLHFL